jgi:hypothetical protein
MLVVEGAHQTSVERIAAPNLTNLVAAALDHADTMILAVNAGAASDGEAAAYCRRVESW